MGSRHTRRHGPGVRNRLVPGIHAKKRDAIVNAHCARECRDPGLHLSQLPLGFAVPAKELHVSRMTLNDGAVVADTDGKAALRGEMFDALSYAIIMADEALAGLGYEDAIVLNTTVMCGDLITHFNGEHVYNHHDLKYKVITSGLRVNASVMLRVRRPSHRLGGKPVRFLWNVSLVPKELHATGHLNKEFIECRPPPLGDCPKAGSNDALGLGLGLLPRPHVGA